MPESGTNTGSDVKQSTTTSITDKGKKRVGGENTGGVSREDHEGFHRETPVQVRQDYQFADAKASTSKARRTSKEAKKRKLGVAKLVTPGKSTATSPKKGSTRHHNLVGKEGQHVSTSKVARLPINKRTAEDLDKPSVRHGGRARQQESPVIGLKTVGLGCCNHADPAVFLPIERPNKALLPEEGVWYVTCTTPTCGSGDGTILVLYEADLVARHRQSTQWWDLRFISQMLYMMVHVAHPKGTILRVDSVNSDFTRQLRKEPGLDPYTENVVTVLLRDHHYGVINIDVPGRVVTVVDGLLAGSTKNLIHAWGEEIAVLLVRAGIMDANVYGMRTWHYDLDEGQGLLKVVLPQENEDLARKELVQVVVVLDNTVAQNDHYNCGPIAVATVATRVFGLKVKWLPTMGWVDRDELVDLYECLLVRLRPTMTASRVRRSKRRVDALTIDLSGIPDSP